jgi:hypothetical protein
MYPHERSLVKRLENKPFALVGVNSDASKEELKRIMEKEKITWRSFFDGGSTGGPIATRWNIQGWPTLYLLDAKGVIRYQDLRGRDLDAAVDHLLKEVDRAK